MPCERTSKAVVPLVCAFALAMFSGPSAQGQFDSGSDGTDGVFSPAASIEVDNFRRGGERILP